MWTHEHTAETPARPQAVWQILRDLDQWATWDTSMEWARLQGPFQAGSQVVMKPKGQDPITSVIVQATENQVYADQTSMGGVTLRFSHTLEPLASGGTRVTHRLEITGPAAGQVGPELGPAITEDFRRRCRRCWPARPPHRRRRDPDPLPGGPGGQPLGCCCGTSPWPGGSAPPPLLRPAGCHRAVAGQQPADRPTSASSGTFVTKGKNV